MHHEKPRRLFFPVVAVIGMALSIFAQAGQLQGQDLNGAFRPAIELAQKRTVKLFGATVGNVDGYGSGIIVSADGKIVTADGVHLTGQSIRVVTFDGVTHEAKLLRSDPKLQLALIQIDAPTPDYFEPSSQPVGAIGDWILGVSNPFKVAERNEPLSVTLGMISLRTACQVKSTPRDIAYDGDMVLIDAITSNPGAPGGAGVTANGELVGMIGKVIESPDTRTRMNYLVPAERIKDFLDGNLSQGTVALSTNTNGKQSDLGIRLFRLGGASNPAFVDRVIRGGPAAKAGIKPDDLIVTIGGKKIDHAASFNEVANQLPPDVPVVVVVKRREELLRFEITPVAKE
jgi:serine protease Do